MSMEQVDLTDPEIELRILVAQAKIPSDAEWARRSDVPAATLSRYAGGITQRRQYAIVRKLAQPLGITSDELDELFERIRFATASKLGWTDWPTPSSTGSLALASG